MTTKNWKAPALSPRELGHALGVSESSVKRWIDSGLLPAMRTAGGHRRVEFLSALRFARESKRELVHPSALGLPAVSELHLNDPDALGDRLAELLIEGQDQEVTRILLAALASRAFEPAELFDGPVRSALIQIGHLWDGGRDGIFVEHRATQILLRVLDQLEALYEVPAGAPIAVGGSIDGDSSLLPTRMAAIALAAEGIEAVNLGADTPVEVLLDAAQKLRARLVWVSVSHVSDAVRQRQSLLWLGTECEARGMRCALGGRQVQLLRLSGDCGLELGAGMRDLVRMVH